MAILIKERTGRACSRYILCVALGSWLKDGREPFGERNPSFVLVQRGSLNGENPRRNFHFDECLEIQMPDLKGWKELG